VGTVYSPEGKVRVSSPEGLDAPSVASPEDPEAKQGRRLALMASLADGLPTLPAYVFELNSLLGATPVNLKRVAEVIRTDPSLTAQVLRLCNSAFMGFREEVTTVEHAVILLGTERLRTLVLTCSLIEYAAHKLGSEDIQSFWQHCFLTAALSERLARGIAYPQPEEAYLAGLLHDIGALPLLVIGSSHPGEPHEATPRGWWESVRLERERFGTDHCEVGHWIGTSWSFSSTLLEVIVNHHNPRDARHEPQLVGLVAAADQYCVRRGVMLGAQLSELGEPTAGPNHEILRACLPGLALEEAGKLGEMLEADFLHLIQLMEFGAAGLFGGSIPKNPFRELER
jgi:HD-like signal output (HDOD) protein